MTYWKMPPIAKVYEALTAVADNRVRMVDDHTAEVISSSGTKTYVVDWEPGFATVASNDNASFWQGYLGYPIIAVLMITGTLAYDADIAQLLRGVEWKRINDQYKSDYDSAIRDVLGRIEAGDAKLVLAEVERVYTALGQQQFGRRRSSQKPPK